MYRRQFLRALLGGSAAVVVSGCGGAQAGNTLLQEGLAPTPTPKPTPGPAPTPPPVRTLRGFTIDQAEADIKKTLTDKTAWLGAARNYQAEVVVQSPDELQAAVNAAFDTARNPEAFALNHRIICAWSGPAYLNAGTSARLTVGSRAPTSTHLRAGGSVTIDAAPGHRPAFGNSVYISGQGIILRNLGFTRQALPDEMAAVISTVSLLKNDLYPFEPVVHFEKCFFGRPEGFGTQRYCDTLLPLRDLNSDRYTKGLSCEGISELVSLKDCIFCELRVGAHLVSSLL